MSSVYHALLYSIMIGTSIITGLISNTSEEGSPSYAFESLESENEVEISFSLEEKEDVIPSFDIGFSRVVLYDAKNNKNESLELEEYVKRVLMAEMPSWYHEEALKSAAVAVRTFTVYNILNGKTHQGGAQVCTDSSHCQAYYTFDEAVKAWNEKSAESAWEKISKAVDSTSGVIATYDKMPILALYHASGYLKTRSSEEVFGGRLEYLESVDISHENGSTTRKSEKSFSSTEFLSTLNLKGCECVESVWRNRKCEGLKVISEGKEYFWKSADVRRMFSLKSGNFYIEKKNDKFVFTVFGYGHGVGLSQDGAQILALSGMGYRQILEKYYTGINFAILKKGE